MNNNQGQLQSLKCSVTNYDWGIRGVDSKIARLFLAHFKSQTEPGKPYSEFWMGTHDSGSSTLASSNENETLKSWLSRNPHVLGEKVVQKWGLDLPFLCKVVSVAKASPIQAHDKPGMVLALTQFEAFCGFISFKELQVVIQNVPEFSPLVGFHDVLSLLALKDHGEKDDKDRYSLLVFTRLMSIDNGTVTQVVGALKTRLVRDSQKRNLTDKEKLALRLEEQNPGDIVVIASFFLRYVKLKPQEAISIRPNELHAYISGECIECMATSGNVVRVGLPTEPGDGLTTINLLQGPPVIMPGFTMNPCLRKYIPPFDEFEIDLSVLPGLELNETFTFPALPGPSIFLLLEGAAFLEVGSSRNRLFVADGDVLFVPANIGFVITQHAPGSILYRAGVNLRFFRAFQVRQV